MKPFIPRPDSNAILVIPIKGTVAAAMLRDEDVQKHILRELATHDAGATHIILCGTYITPSEEDITRDTERKLRRLLVKDRRPLHLEGPNFNEANVHSVINYGCGPQEITSTGKTILNVWTKYTARGPHTDIVLFAAEKRWKLWSGQLAVMSLLGDEEDTGPWNLPPLKLVLELRRWRRYLHDLWTPPPAIAV